MANLICFTEDLGTDIGRSVFGREQKVAASSEREHGMLVALPCPAGKSMLVEDVLIWLFSASPLLREVF